MSYKEVGASSNASQMILAIFECHRAARGIAENSVGMSLKFEAAYKILHQTASQIPKENRKAVFDEIQRLLDLKDFSSLESFSQLLPVWIEFTKEALETETLDVSEKAILRRYIRMRQLWKIEDESLSACSGFNCADNCINLKRSILDKPVDPTNIYPGNPTRRTGPLPGFAGDMVSLFLRHIRSRSSATSASRFRPFVHHAIRDIFGGGIMFVNLCEDQWTTFVLCSARNLYDEMSKRFPNEKAGAQSLAISFTILLHVYYPIDGQFLEPILAIVPESLRDLSDPVVIDRYYRDVSDRLDFDNKQSACWFHKSFPVKKEALQFYRELFLEGMKLSDQSVKRECIGLGFDLAHAIAQIMEKCEDNQELHMYRERDSDLLEEFVDKDPVVNKSAKHSEYWAAFKPAWIKIAITAGGLGGQTKQFIEAYETIRPVIIACRESFGKYPIRSSLTLADIRSSKFFCEFSPEIDREIRRFILRSPGPLYSGHGCHTVKHTLDQILPAYEYVLKILSLLHPSAKTVELTQIGILSQKDKIDRYAMDVLFLLSKSTSAVNQARAVSRVLYELIIELFGKEKRALASRIESISCMFFAQMNRFVQEIDELQDGVSLLRQFWHLMNWKGHMLVTHNGEHIGVINSTDSIDFYVNL